MLVVGWLVMVWWKREGGRDIYIFITRDQIQHSSSRHHLRQIAQLERLFAVLVQGHAQILDEFWVEAAAGAKFRQVILEPVLGANECSF